MMIKTNILFEERLEQILNFMDECIQESPKDDSESAQLYDVLFSNLNNALDNFFRSDEWMKYQNVRDSDTGDWNEEIQLFDSRIMG